MGLASLSRPKVGARDRHPSPPPQRRGEPTGLLQPLLEHAVCSVCLSLQEACASADPRPGFFCPPPCSPGPGLRAVQDRTTGQPWMSWGKSPWPRAGSGVAGGQELPGLEAKRWPQGSPSARGDAEVWAATCSSPSQRPPFRSWFGQGAASCGPWSSLRSLECILVHGSQTRTAPLHLLRELGGRQAG